MIDASKYGVSFSAKQCRNFGVDPHAVLEWLIAQGWRRFRLMSYWNEHEKTPGSYDFTELDWQIRAIANADGEVSLCLGAKQPRWPEYHWPNWAWDAPKDQRNAALLQYVQTVVERYKDEVVITCWQLENEALLRGFGTRIEIDRGRLRAEYKLVRQLDPHRPVVMSTSNGWGVPLRRPLPRVVGFSYYPIMYRAGKYRTTIQKPGLHRQRAVFIRAFLGREVFVHELQCEPWGPTAIWKMTPEQQAESMSTTQIARNIAMARQIGVFPIDLWGAEWWYWRWLQGDHSIWDSVENGLRTS